MAVNRAPRWLLPLTLLYTLFVVYGSLVPLEYVAMPFSEALARFREIPYLNLGLHSRADWVANILLFIPLTFLWMALLDRGRRFLPIAMLVWVVAVSFSVGIEFTQLFFPQRTVSRNDIIAETIGAALGILLWRLWGRALLGWVGRWSLANGAAGKAERLLYLYLAVLFGYNLLPLDLTISPVEIFHKWQDGRVLLLPFQGLHGDWAQRLYDLVMDALIWAPPAFLWVLSGRKSASRAFWWTLAAAGLLELAQLFVWSRVTDVTDLLSAAVGAGLGVFAARRLAGGHRFATTSVGARWWPPALLAAGWLVVLIVVFWYPWDFRTDGQFIKSRLPLLAQAPFHAYYFGTEYRAITSLLSKLAFFVPLGFLLSMLGVSSGRRPWVIALLVAIAVGAGLFIELGQLALPGKSVDLADWLVSMVGVWLGYRGWCFLRRSDVGGRHAGPSAPSVDRPKATSGPGGLRGWGLSILLIVLLGGFAMQSSAVPYNLRELMGGGLAWLGVASLLVAALWAFGAPMWLSGWLLGGDWRRTLLFPLLVVLHALLTYLLLRMVAPLESLHDIVGAPVLAWPPELERMLRFVALFGAVSLLLGGAALAWRVMNRYHGGRLFLRWLLVALLLLPLCHWAVVSEAATDNLTELMRAGGGASASLLLAGWWFLLGLTGSLLALAWAGVVGRRSAAVVFLLLSLPLGWWLLAWGTEASIHKYGKVFSAMQFLFSPDRDAYVRPGVLIWRYAVAHLVLAVLIAMAQYPVLVWNGAFRARSGVAKNALAPQHGG